MYISLKSRKMEISKPLLVPSSKNRYVELFPQAARQVYLLISRACTSVYHFKII